MAELKAFIFIQLSLISILIHTLRTQSLIIILKIFIGILDHFYINLNVLLNGHDIMNEKFFIHFSIVRYNCGNRKCFIVESSDFIPSQLAQNVLPQRIKSFLDKIFQLMKNDFEVAQTD